MSAALRAQKLRQDGRVELMEEDHQVLRRTAPQKIGARIPDARARGQERINFARVCDVRSCVCCVYVNTLVCKCVCHEYAHTARKHLSRIPQ